MPEKIVNSKNPHEESSGIEVKPRKVKSLRLGRTLALQVLYEADVTSHDWRTSLAHHSSERNYSRATTRFAELIVSGVLEDIKSLDEEIERFAPNYPLQQLSVVDRNVLRLALHEMRREPHTPLKVIINEAVEIAKTYGSESSYKFVNGVLGSLYDAG